MQEPIYRRVVDGAGNVSFVEVPTNSRQDATQLAGTAISAAGNWVSARSGETSTKLGVIGGAVSAPAIADYAGKAIIAGLAGDYVSCALYGVPALTGIIGSIAAVVIPDKPKGPTDEDIHAAVSRMSRDQLIGLLAQPVETRPVPTAQGV